MEAGREGAGGDLGDLHGGLTSVAAGGGGGGSPISMTSNSLVLCFTSVGNTSVGGSWILINPKKCISYHF